MGLGKMSSEARAGLEHREAALKTHVMGAVPKLASRGRKALERGEAHRAHSSGDCAEATECLRKVDIGISVNPKRETVLSYFANEEALGFELVCGADFEYYGPSKTS